jgi:hypothetical protein
VAASGAKSSAQEFYIRSVPETVRIAAESLDQRLKKVPDSVNNPN